MEAKIVTAYVPISGHPRTAREYGDLGENLFSKVQGNFSIHPFYERVQDTWLMKEIKKLPFSPTHSVSDNPHKNSLAYHCVQHQKIAWLLKAAILDPKPTVFVWMDYGIGYLPGVTPDIVNEFMANVQEHDFAIPGCWERGQYVNNDFFPCWRFCGSLMVVPKDKLHKVYKGLKTATLRQINKTGNVTWEVNDYARAEPNWPPCRWYKADHNETMFTHYRKDLSWIAPQSPSSAPSAESTAPTKDQPPMDGDIALTTLNS